MMNIKAYLQIIERKVCRELSDLQPRAIFQQDSAPCHKAKMITNCFKQMKITVLDWPGNSPDLNPIKNLWSFVKNRLRKMDCSDEGLETNFQGLGLGLLLAVSVLVS